MTGASESNVGQRVAMFRTSPFEGPQIIPLTIVRLLGDGRAVLRYPNGHTIIDDLCRFEPIPDPD